MANFTPEEISQFLAEFFDTVGKRQYIGARYVPIIGRRGESSIEWDNSAPYEPLTIVMYQSNSYTSRQYVPAGAEITNTDYWAKTADYNAQIEQYRSEVVQLSQEFADLEGDVDRIIAEANAELQADYEQTKENLQDAVDAEIDRIDESVADIREEVFGDRYMVVIGDSFSNDSQSGSPLWYTYVARQKGLVPYCNARDGRGFGAYIGSTTYTFLQQAQIAATELDTDKVELVYIVGGLNDTRNSAYNLTEFRTGVVNVLDYCVEHFDKAKIEVYGPESFPQINRNTQGAATWMAYICAMRGIEYHDLSGKFNAYPDFFGGNGGAGSQNSMHPSAIGEGVIAQAILGHGILPHPSYVPSTIPADLQTPVILFKLYKHDYEDPSDTTPGRVWIECDDTLVTQKTVFSEDGIHFKIDCTITPTTIATTSDRLAVTLPFGFGFLCRDYGTYHPYGTISQLYNNVVVSGWLDMTLTESSAPRLMFNVNDSAGVRPQTGIANAIRVQCEVAQRG